MQIIITKYLIKEQDEEIKSEFFHSYNKYISNLPFDVVFVVVIQSEVYLLVALAVVALQTHVKI